MWQAKPVRVGASWWDPFQFHSDPSGKMAFGLCLWGYQQDIIIHLMLHPTRLQTWRYGDRWLSQWDIMWQFLCHNPEVNRPLLVSKWTSRLKCHFYWYPIQCNTRNCLPWWTCTYQVLLKMKLSTLVSTVQHGGTSHLWSLDFWPGIWKLQSYYEWQTISLRF